MNRFAVCVVSALLAAVPLAAQHLPQVPRERGGCRSELDARLAFGLCPDSTFDFYASGQFREGVPRPDQVLGYPLGSWHTTYGRMERYVDTLAQALPQRVRVFPYGQSVERQTMYLLAISSEANLARLDEIREGVGRLADPRRTSASEAQALAARLPVVVWINSANDGNESAAFEAAIQLAYQISAGEDARTRNIRDNTLVLINMAHNPESHERHVAWYNGFVMGDANPMALEHNAPWGMSTNNNHYQIDLNRDALALTQTETRAVAAELQRWHPQVFVDLHGQTTQYFFPPAADPINPIFPAQTERWLETFGRGNAAAFDQFGWSYYTRDVFDLYYPGYWDSYPSLHGATGMTYETDGGGTKGVRWRRDDNTILTFADGIAHHFVASMATLETAVRNREARLRDFGEYFSSALAAGQRDPVRTVVLLPGADPHRAHRLATTLLRHGVEVSRVTSAGTLAGTDYLSGARERRSVPAGSYVIDLAQPNYRIAKTLLTPRVELPERFAAQERARQARNARRPAGEQEEHAFYDVTAWNLPMAHGVPAIWAGGRAGLAAEPLRLAPGADKEPGGWEGDVAFPTGGGVTGRAQSAYIWNAGGIGATRLMARLLGEGFNVVVAGLPVVVDSVDYPRGAFILRVDRNRPEVHQRVDALAREAGVRVIGARSAFPERGPTGTGSNAAQTLRRPRVAVLAGEGTSATSYGALWFHLQRRLGQPFTALRASDLSRFALDDFDVLIVPDGNGYGRVISNAAVPLLRGWMERGGTLIGYAGGASYLAEQQLGAQFEQADSARPPADTLARITRALDAAAPGAVVPPSTSPVARPDAPVLVPGAFLRGRLDRTHWLTTGYEQNDLPLLVQNFPLRASREGANPVTYAEGNRLVLSGFTWGANTTRAYAGQPYATVDGVGRGQLILFAEDPVYRLVFDAPAGLLANAIFLSGSAR